MAPAANPTVARARLTFAWIGAALFVGSLLYFAWFYFVRLGRPAASSTAPLRAIAIDVALFALFALHHSIMARPGVKARVNRVAPPELERATFVWVSSVLLAVVCAAWQRIPGSVYAVPAPWSWILYGVQIAGLGLTLRASGKLDVLELAGVRQVQTSRRLRQTAETHDGPSAGALAPLQMSGPYRLVRHPVYLGWVMIVFGAPVMTADRMTFAAISTVYLIVATPLEERALRQAFGESYAEYSKRVRWRIVPGIW
jgi:protein-S-isoprenylcysteine O-methyltransferase Ste14